MEEKIDAVQKDVSAIKERFRYIYGFVAGISFVGAFIIDVVKNRLSDFWVK